jgi:hypothetical protein
LTPDVVSPRGSGNLAPIATTLRRSRDFTRPRSAVLFRSQLLSRGRCNATTSRDCRVIDQRPTDPKSAPINWPRGPARRPTGGRPSKLTAEVQATICKHVSGGLPFGTAACTLAGIDSRTGQYWLAQGKVQTEARGLAPDALMPAGWRGGDRNLVHPDGRPMSGAQAARVVQFYQAVSRARAEDTERRVHDITRPGNGGAVVYERTVETTDRGRRSHQDHGAAAGGAGLVSPRVRARTARSTAVGEGSRRPDTTGRC